MPGRPRNPRSNGAILAATLAVLADRGYDRLTIDEVARTAGVGKSSLYTRFASKAELVAAAMASRQREMPADTGDLRLNLIACLRAAERNVGHVGVGIMCLREGAALGHNTSTSAASLIAPFAARIARLLDGATSRGLLPPEADSEAIVELLIGALFSRALLGGSGDASTEPWPDRAVDVLLAAPSARARPAPISARA